MKINLKDVQREADNRYRAAWFKRMNIDIAFARPESGPKGIESDEVKAILAALVNAINREDEDEENHEREARI